MTRPMLKLCVYNGMHTQKHTNIDVCRQRKRVQWSICVEERQIERCVLRFQVLITVKKYIALTSRYDFSKCSQTHTLIHILINENKRNGQNGIESTYTYTQLTKLQRRRRKNIENQNYYNKRLGKSNSLL